MTDATTQTGLPFNDVIPGAVLEIHQEWAGGGGRETARIGSLSARSGGLRLPLDGHQRGLAAVFRGGVLPLRRRPAQRTTLVLKVRLPDKANPVVPSLISVWPGADLQEREVYDMMGIRFEGHPNLRRILLWDGFEGWPLRKDCKESYFEEDLKPFKSRHPDGQHQWAEDRVPWKDNITYPVAWDPDLFTQPTVQYRRIMEVDEAGNGDGSRSEDRAHPGQHGAAAPQHPRRLPHGAGAGGRERRRAGAGDRLPAPLPREDRRAQHLHHEHALHRPAGLHHVHVEQLRLCAGGGEADGPPGARARRLHPRDHGRADPRRSAISSPSAFCSTTWAPTSPRRCTACASES